jgi:hypothetical protein
MWRDRDMSDVVQAVRWHARPIAYALLAVGSAAVGAFASGVLARGTNRGSTSMSPVELFTILKRHGLEAALDPLRLEAASDSAVLRNAHQPRGEVRAHPLLPRPQNACITTSAGSSSRAR